MRMPRAFEKKTKQITPEILYLDYDGVLLEEARTTIFRSMDRRLLEFCKSCKGAIGKKRWLALIQDGKAFNNSIMKKYGQPDRFFVEKGFFNSSDAFYDFYHDVPENDLTPIRPNPSVIRAVRDLNDVMPIYIVTANTRKLVERTLPLIGLDTTDFRDIIDFKDLGFRSKRISDVYRDVLKNLGHEAQKVAFIDDSPCNVRAAEQVGIQAIHYMATTEGHSIVDGYIPKRETGSLPHALGKLRRERVAQLKDLTVKRLEMRKLRARSAA